MGDKKNSGSDTRWETTQKPGQGVHRTSTSVPKKPS